MHLTLTFPVQSSGRFFTRGNVRGYCFGFNGQMKDDEVYGEGNSYTAEFWQYDPRLGRRWNVDPKFTGIPEFTPYVCFGDNPISNVDPDGAWFFGLFGSTKQQRQAAKRYAEIHGGTVNNYFSSDINVSSFKQSSIVLVNSNGVLEQTTENTLTRQYFYRDGSQKVPNTLSPKDYNSKSKTGFEQVEDYAKSDSETYLEDAGKIILGMGIGAINAPAVYITQETWTGKTTTEDERIDAFSSIMPTPFKTDLFPKGLTRKYAFKLYKSQTKNVYTRSAFGDNFKKIQGKAFNAAWEEHHSGKTADDLTHILNGIKSAAEYAEKNSEK